LVLQLAWESGSESAMDLEEVLLLPSVTELETASV
jgi:hypothetical protein